MLDLRNSPPEKFTDGLMFYGVITTERQAGKKVGEAFLEKGKLFFNRLSIRQQDYEIHSTDQTIDVKIKTFYTRGVSKDSHKVKINDELFDINAIDSDTEDRYMYWYLSKRGRLNDGT